MIGEHIRDKKGDKVRVPSTYKPSKHVINFTKRIKEDYTIGANNLSRPFREFNDRSVKQVMNADQKAFNNYLPPRSRDPLESWKAQTIRPLTRNKIISIAAHVTAATIFPNIFAQNDQDEEDKLAGQVMRELIQYVREQSRYDTAFLFAIIGMLVNPCVYMKADFVQVMQKVKELDENGKVTGTREVLDEVFSGFKSSLVSSDEIMIANMYEYELQKQRFIIHRRYIDFDEATALYGNHENFKHVKPGVRIFYDDDHGMFYEQKDDTNPTLVEEVTYYNRTEDLQVTFVNGILMTGIEDPIKHRTPTGLPKYPFAKGGYEPIDEQKFFYYKSAVSKLAPDQEVLDQMWNMVLDGSFLSVIRPTNIFGGKKTDRSVVVPGATNYYDKETEVQPMDMGSDLNAGYTALSALEASMSESTQDAFRSGAQQAGARTAREVLITEKNANIQLGLFRRMVSDFVQDYGELMLDDVVQHMTVAEVDQLTAGSTRMRYRTFILPNQVEDGRTVTKRFKFDNSLGEMSEEDERKEGFRLLNQEGGLDADTKITLINAPKFRLLKYQVVVAPDEVSPRSKELEDALKLEGYDRMIQNPYVDQVGVTRDFLVDVFANGEADKYMQKAGLEMPGGTPPEGGQGGSEIASQITGSNSLNSLIEA